ncbi:MAG: cytochrome c biogenesis protein CcdA [Dehalococcoidia bacterium]|nr:cytochrome c biogenesis protein CcdA [Dehalococcoidia bacterium]
MGDISPLVAFGAGLLSFVSPCVLPLVPVYLASLCGPEILEPRVNSLRLPVFLHALSFVIGFSLIFTILGVSAALTGLALNFDHRIVGSLLIAFGLFMMAALRMPWLNYEKHLNLSLSMKTGYLRSFLIGAIFSLAWTPCVGPILGGVLALAASSETAGCGAYLLASYSIGLGLPFLIVGVAFSSLTPLLKKVQPYSGLVYVISGSLLIAVGVLTLTNRLNWFSWA